LKIQVTGAKTGFTSATKYTHLWVARFRFKVELIGSQLLLLILQMLCFQTTF